LLNIDLLTRRMAMTPEREAIAVAMLAEGKSQAEIARDRRQPRAPLPLVGGTKGGEAIP
jgi:hypothetical protein